MCGSDKARYLIGSVAVLALVVMAFAFGLGKGEEQTSFGLIQVLSFLGVVVGRFAEWAYHTAGTGQQVPPKTKGCRGLAKIAGGGSEGRYNPPANCPYSKENKE
jgi:hypothetical protein